MIKHHVNINNFFSNIDALASLIFRFGIGIAFIIHGANDSMVPFTESNLLDKQLQNSELLISFVFEHREISTNRGFVFKIKELLKMINFFARYFRYNK